MGGNPLGMLGGGGGGGPSVQLPGAVPPTDASPQEQAAAELVTRVLGDTEDVWNELFGRMGRDYPEPKLVLFTGAVDSACGQASSAVGPFYCPGDQTIYIDLAFFNDLSGELGAGGDFAPAYVIAHEVGHHVQNVLGDLRGSRETGADSHAVRVELQADFYAGVWAHHAQATRGILERGDIQEAINAAAAVGDDRLQRRSQGRVVPDSFTHGTSEQRMRWFMLGYESGDPAAGDTFSARDL
jgi:predicted metalloprotease